MIGQYFKTIYSDKGLVLNGQEQDCSLGKEA